MDSTHSRMRFIGILYQAAVVVVFVVLFAGPAGATEIGLGELPLVVLVAAHFAYGVRLVLPAGPLKRRKLRRALRMPELLLVSTLALFVFSYLFALNANLEYVQRFVLSGGDLNFAVDSETERNVALLRYLPLLLVNAFAYFAIRGMHGRVAAFETRRDRLVGPWRLLLTFASVILSTLALPSFVSIEGIGILSWIALVPLFVVLRRSRFSTGVFYLVTYGVLHNTLVNYWLGTFSLVSLQVTMVVLLLYYLIFSPVALAFLKTIRWGKFLVLPLAWTFFEFMRSVGFLGYPWGLVGHGQYANLPLIQVSSVTGVWGVSFLVLLVNSALAELALVGLDRLFPGTNRLFAGARSRVAIRSHVPTHRRYSPAFLAAGGTAAVLALVMLLGGLALTADSQAQASQQSVRIALIQQNSDPRKHDYSRTFGSLTTLTDAALASSPDLVAWSETAFVPNIRRWSQEDPRRYSLARLVGRLLVYLEDIDTWLLTGNDDYDRVLNEDGEEVERLNHNAAVLFNDEAERVETYHKIRLVPFTETFPYRETFPWLYQMLLDFDVNFWEAGDERTIFEHPEFRFFTPICFEDVFPDDIRRFVLEDADVILNISNDYWSLDPVEGKQHFVAGMFRAVENRRPLVRSTASGLTAHVDEYGRILATLPYYEEGYLVTDVELKDRPMTFYTQHGDWFPWMGLIVLGLLLLFRGLHLLFTPRLVEPRGSGSRRLRGRAGRESR